MQCTDAARCFEFARPLDTEVKQARDSGESQRTLRLVKSIDGLFTAVMQQALSGDKEERRQKFHTDFIQTAVAELEKLNAEGKPKKTGLPNPVLILLLKCFLSVASGIPSEWTTDSAALKKRLHKLLWSTATHNDLCAARSWVRLKVISELLTIGGANGKEGEESMEREYEGAETHL